MKKRKWNVERLLSGALALLGFAGCSDINDAPDLYGPPSLYGTPTMGYRVLGTVTDGEGEPLKDIQVIIENPGISAYYDDEGKLTAPERDTVSMKVIPDTVYTDEKGRFSGPNVIAASLNDLSVELRDIDGEANGGEFDSQKLTENDFDKKQVKDADGWYRGDFELSKTVQMKRKKE